MLPTCTIVAGIGQAGLKTSCAFWLEIARQHSIDPESGSAIDSPTGSWEKFFVCVARGTEEERYVPRAIFVDADQRTADAIKLRWRNFFNPASFVTSGESSGNNFAVANRQIGDELVTAIRGLWQREAAKAEEVDSCIVFHAYGGGSGSGLSGRLFEILNQIGAGAALLSVGILPSKSVSASVTEPYNAIFGLSKVAQHCQAGLLFRNDDLQLQVDSRNRLDNPSVDDLNLEIAKIVAALTSSVRFSDSNGKTKALPEIVTDLAPHPEFRFFSASQIGFDQILRKNSAARSIPDILEVLLDQKSIKVTGLGGRVFSLFVASSVLSKNTQQSTDNKSDEAYISVLDSLSPSSDQVLFVFVNSSRIVDFLETVLKSFDQLWERKAFANWFLEAGYSEVAIDKLRREMRFRCERYRDVEPDSY